MTHSLEEALLKAARDLALGNGWKQPRNIDVMVKYTGAKAEVIQKARAHVLDPNLDTDPAVLESMQKLAGEMGYLKYKEMLPASRIFNPRSPLRAARCRPRSWPAAGSRS